MIICENKELLCEVPWLKIKQDKVVAKIYESGNFVQSCIVPTVKYPMSDDTIHVFFDGNTKKITDEKVLEVFDSIDYHVGCCYTNSGTLLERYLENQINNVEMFCGWVFCDCELPVHHCWLVYNGESIIDLSADRKTYLYNLEHLYKTNEISGQMSVEQHRELMIDFYVSTKSWKNSARCGAVGTADGKLYIGSRCKNEHDALALYHNLIQRFPHHEISANLNQNGLNAFQQKLSDMGLV